MKPFYLLFAVLLLHSPLLAQTSHIDPSEFVVSGNARQSGDHCFTLTENQLWQGGTVWYRKPITLNDPFEMELDLSFGCADDGADGMVFIFHPSLKDGYQGEGIGFGGLYPSFGIEMDTYENPHLDDPWYDHLALMKHGGMHHRSGITDPVPLLPFKKNIEDCKARRVKITWAPADKNLKIYVDGASRMSTNYDIVGKIFMGNPKVYWGISSATGGKRNRHQVCLEKLEFTTPDVFEKSTEDLLLKGETYTLKNVDFLSGKSELEAISFKELDKLAALLQAHPKYNIHVDGHTDSVGSAIRNKDLSQKRADEVVEYLMSKGISLKRLKATGFGEQFPKVNNDTPAKRKINRRVDVYLVDPRA